MVRLAASALLLAALVVASAAKLPCPRGLKCADQPSRPVAQLVPNPGSSGRCDPLPQLVPSLDDEYGLMALVGGTGAAWEARAYETPYLIRGSLHISSSYYNAFTAFHPTALPLLHTPGVGGLPFQTRISGAANTTRNRNIAGAYAIYRVCSWVNPGCEMYLNPIMAVLGLDVNYTKATDLTDPRDIGNAVGISMHDHSTKDNWNAYGDMTSSTAKVPFGDYTNFVPDNTGFKLKDITKWAPLHEHNGNGYVTEQTHVGALLRNGDVHPFSMMDKKAFYDRHTLPMSRKPWKAMDKMTPADLAKYKKEVDLVIETSTTIDDRQKMIAEFYDMKLISFGSVPMFNGIQKFGYNMMDIAQMMVGMHGALYDAKLAAWYNKFKFNTIRPVSAIHYLYGNSDITAYAGRHNGTATIPGSEFQSYLRTMPHADFPSGTACICQAAGEFFEAHQKMGAGKLYYASKFEKGCSVREPGKTPASTIDIMWEDTETFIQECAQSRLHAGVHFQAAIDGALEICKGVGTDAAKVLADMVAGKASAPA